MELTIIARFRAREGLSSGLAEVLPDQVEAVRDEPGCLEIDAYRSTRDPLLFFIHSRWTDEASFEVHAELPRTKRFLEAVEPLIDHPLDITRAVSVGAPNTADRMLSVGPR
jgi:quinol monooxygenase YgiN